MTIPVNIFAYTPPGADFPPYLSINQVGDAVVVYVRSTKEHGGATAQITLPADEFLKLQAALESAPLATAIKRAEQERADYAFMGVDQPV